MIGHLSNVGFRNFYVISKYPIITDFQCFNPRPLPLRGLNPNQNLLGILHQFTQLVKLAVEAGSDNAAIFQKRWRLLHNGALQKRTKIFQRVDSLEHLPEKCALAIGKQLPQLRQHAACGFQRLIFAWTCISIDNPSH